MAVEAAAVERLTRAARAAVDYLDDGDGFVREELRAAVEAAEKWGTR